MADAYKASDLYYILQKKFCDYSKSPETYGNPGNPDHQINYYIKKEQGIIAAPSQFIS